MLDISTETSLQLKKLNWCSILGRNYDGICRGTKVQDKAAEATDSLV